MSIEENKNLVRRMYELINRRDIDSYFRIFAPGYVEHYPDFDLSLEESREVGIKFLAAFPDFISTIEDMVAEGDKVAYRVTHRGTHKGEYMGIAPTGKEIKITNAATYRINGGRCTECWVTADMLRLMQQLGAIPAEPPKK